VNDHLPIDLPREAFSRNRASATNKPARVPMDSGMEMSGTELIKGETQAERF
jgi:hypothetical protein